MSVPEFDEIIETNDQTEARSEHLDAMRALVGNVYPNKFVRSAISGTEDTITNILHYAPVVEIVAEIKAVVATLAERERPPAEIKDALNARLKEFGNVRIAGRLTTPPRGNFVHLTDGMNKLQIYAKKGTFALVKNDGKDTLDEENGWAAFGLLDHGDFIGVEGYLFITNTGELSVHVEKLQFLAKAMLPMPDKMHGIEDPEIKQRRRYVDLIGSSLQVRSEPPASAGGTDSAINNSDAEGLSPQGTLPPAHAGGSDLSTREVFERRAKVISSLRHFLEDHGYIEVETPMLTPKATGATAKPFKTHHNALDIDLYARIAPELYLKRLVVGGFEKVYELNRNFRNEGISYKHNPEFTMLEFYCAYMDVEGMMNFCEELMQQSVQKATGGLTVNYEGNDIDFGKFERVSMKESIVRFWEDELRRLGGETFDVSWLEDANRMRRMKLYRGALKLADNYEVAKSSDTRRESLWDEAGSTLASLMANVTPTLHETEEPSDQRENDKALLTQDLFEDVAEPNLVQPTFIVDFPKSISPLSKASPDNQAIAERFELFINGMEVANGFSELNDPKEQYERFIDQMSERERGDEEAMILDEDYIRALSYGMPPAAGIGIGIDRLVMLLTNKHSIRDVILFPHMRPERREEEEGSEGEEEM